MNVESDGQEFNRYLQNEKLLLNSYLWAPKRQRHMPMESKAQFLQKHTKVAAIYQLMKSQPSPLK